MELAALLTRLPELDFSDPGHWREALTAYGNALLAVCEQRVALKARFAALVASGDLDAIRGGLKELALADFEELMVIGERLDKQYSDSRDYLLMAVASRKQPEG